MVNAIIFDLDGVIHFTEELFSKWFSKEYNIPDEHMQEFFEKEFKKCLIGELDAKEELENKYLKKWNWNHGVDRFLELWFNYGRIDNDMISLLHDLKQKGIILILCTNNEPYRINHFRENERFEDIFDYIIGSGDIGFKKPEHEIFKKIVELTGFEPEDILFIDDDEKNIKGAKDFGLITHHYTDLEKLEEDLINYEIL